MNEFNSYYEKLNSTQRRIEQHTLQWQAQLRWETDTETVLDLRPESGPRQLHASGESGILLNRLVNRRDEKHALSTLPTYPGPHTGHS